MVREDGRWHRTERDQKEAAGSSVVKVVPAVLTVRSTKRRLLTVGSFSPVVQPSPFSHEKIELTFLCARDSLRRIAPFRETGFAGCSDICCQDTGRFVISPARQSAMRNRTLIEQSAHPNHAQKQGRDKYSLNRASPPAVTASMSRHRALHHVDSRPGCCNRRL